MLTLLALLACAPEPAPAPAEPNATAATRVRLALNWFPEPEFGGFYEGVLSGAYKAAGFDVEIIPGGPGAPTLELLGTGRAEAAITGADDLLLKRNQGIEAVAIWAGFQLSPVGILAHAESGITRFEDIRGGRMAIEVGGPFQSLLWKKYDLSKVEMVPTSGAVASFLADPTMMQQAYITAEPCAVQAKGQQTVFLKAADAGWNPYGTLLAVADPAPAWAADFVAATQRAWQAYLADPSRANAEIARLNDQMTPELLPCVTEAQRPFVLGTDGLGAMSPDRWNATAASLVELGLLPEGTTAAGAWRVLP